jgi:VWFA-related protein
MKLFVVFLMVTSLTLTGTVAQNQSARRKVAKNESSKPANDTMTICQGLALPPGYVIVGYMTSSVCPHGAYVLKKQNAYESSLPIGRNAPANESESAPTAAVTSAQPPTTSARTANGTPARTTKGTGGQPGRTSAPSSDKFAQPSGTSAVSKDDSGEPTPLLASNSRPRRVGATQTQIGPGNSIPSANGQEPGPPTLAGGGDPRPLRPPTLSGTTTDATPESSPAAGNVSPAGPEEVSEGDVVRVDTTLVTVPVSVLDRQGRFVPNLRREDFSVLENGVEQSIAYFEPAEKPFTVALLLDTSPSTQFHMSEIKEAAIAFAKQLRPQDRVLIISFSDEVLLLTEATNDISTITEVVLANVKEGNSTRLYDAVHLAINERLNRIPGRKAMVLFTDGVDTSSFSANYQSTLHEAEELDALIYPVKYDTTDYMRAFQNGGNGNVTIVTRSGNWPFGSSTTTTQVINGPPLNGGAPLPGTTKADYDRADQYLHALADKSGGRLYQANDTTQLSDAFTRIAQELRWQYSIGYYPKAATEESGERRQIRVRVHQSNLAVKARDSYMRSSPATPPK